MAAPLKTKHLYEFGPFRLDPSIPLLLREGDIVPLTPKALETLIVLIKNGGDVVDKEKIIKVVWPSSFVEESNLAQHISALRKALGEENNIARIETIPKRGYRFIGNVREIAVDAVHLAAERQPVPPSPAHHISRRDATPAKSFTIWHWPRLGIPVAALAVLTAVVFGLRLRHAPANSTVRQWMQRQLTANTEQDPVLRSALSPDGKYLAYSGQTGIHVLVVDTGESRFLQSPEKLCFR
jgi:DNA-binding winged helix-turn-helix (wHTH) protein